MTENTVIVIQGEKVRSCFWPFLLRLVQLILQK